MFRIARGCEVCEKGAKLVLFVTGICDLDCFYCPVSEKRRGKDIAWANERPIVNEEDLIIEAERMRALGAGVTGGEPLLRLERCCRFISILKEHFGEDFHIHLYTAKAPSLESIKKLKKAGLDEIRYHILAEKQWKSIEKAVSLGLDVGIEIPVFPNEEGRILGMAERLGRVGGTFINLNELEFSDTNAERMLKRGYIPKSEYSYGVKGSEETAKKAIAIAEERGILLHYCSSSYKDSVQLRKRLLRTAKNIAKPYEEVTEEGLLFKGIIEIEHPTLQRLKEVKRYLVKRYGVPNGLVEVDVEKMRIETSPEIASFFSDKISYRCFLVEEYPTYDRLEVERIPLP